jgi:hypothetical protein
MAYCSHEVPWKSVSKFKSRKGGHINTEICFSYVYTRKHIGGFRAKMSTAVLPIICYHTPFQDPKLNVTNTAPTSQVCESSILLLLIVRNYKAQHWSCLQWHDMHTQFCENCLNGSKAEMEGTHSMVIYMPVSEIWRSHGGDYEDCEFLRRDAT